MPIEYSDKVIDLATNVFGMGKTKIIVWSLRPPFAWDVRKAFEQTEQEDEELLKYYSQFITESMTKKERVKAIANAVNNRITYVSDSRNWGKAEYWAKPIDTHNKQKDDCDGYAVLICKILRLMNFAPWEVFVRTGVVKADDGRLEGHAYVIWYDYETNGWYPVEGSFYPTRAMNGIGVVKLEDNPTYTYLGMETWFMTNDKLSYSNSTFPMKLV